MSDSTERASRRRPSGAVTELIVPFSGAATAHDRARPRTERAAALVRPDAGEPAATIYTGQWREARECAGRIRRTEAGRRFARLLDHHERGWVLVRPLALAAEEARRWTTGSDAASALYRFAEVDIVDLYRHNAFRCADMVLAAPGGDDFPSTDDVDAETDAFYRYVQLLRLASAHPLAPPEFRVFADHLAGLDAWYAEFGRIFAPAAEAFHRRHAGQGV